VKILKKIKKQGRELFPLHPTLIALQNVLAKEDQDLGSINRSHPRLVKHKFYDKDYQFPDDLSSMLPPMEDRWWEQLGMD
jgi:hypothetical protein